MIYVLTPQEMRAADATAVAQAGGDALMRDAGRQIAARLRATVPPGGRIVAFAGPGNNGGDAFAALAEIARDYVCVVHAGPPADPSPERQAAEERARAAGVAIAPLPQSEEAA
ncbi:MAG TPA: NAD(P)H-hydrate epimerase, partial [Candidatus Tumulicola sp.]|nr:NAD(P)H-hydrate epimerase [Candidatus Tumulicola sp.]